MPRGRIISRQISTDDKVAHLSDEADRLLYTWLILHLDKEGRIPADPHIIKGIVVPRTTHTLKKISKTVESLVKLKLCVRYSVNSFDYLEFPNFLKHQAKSALDRETPSVIPPNPARATQELRKSNSGETLAEVESKIKIKIKAEVEGDATVSFLPYKQKLKTNYPELDIDAEWERCQIWFRDHKKMIKSPSLALGNWCKKEMEIREAKLKGDQGGTHRGHSKQASTEELKASIGRPLD